MTFFIRKHESLCLDFDNKHEYESFKKRLAWLKNKLPFKITKAHVLKTYHGFHVILDLQKSLSPRETIFFQTLLGSDYRREYHNYIKITRGKKFFKNCWNTLFMEKYNAKGDLLSQEKYDKQLTKDLRQVLKGQRKKGFWEKMDKLLKS